MGIQERKTREKARRRNEIVDAAEKIIFKNGIDKATVDNIAAEAELSKATLYLYFKSKEEIYFAISMRGQKILFAMIERKIKKLTDTKDKILAFLKTIVNFKQANPNYFNAFFYFATNEINLNKDNFYVLESRERHRKYLTIWRDLIKKGKDEGVIRKNLDEINTVLLLWMQLIGFLKIYSVIEPRLQDDFDITRGKIFDEYFDLILNGMVKK